MRLNRVHCETPLEAGTELDLSPAAASHVARVLRLREGSAILAFDGRGDDHRCEILAVRGERVRVRVLERVAGLPEPALAVTLVQAVSRGERMDLTLQKATELGVRAVVPVLSARSVVKLDEDQAARKLRHWQAVVTAACEQCGRSVLPLVHPARDLARHLAGPPVAPLRLVPSPGAAMPIARVPAGDAVELLVGPEGGFEDEELARAAAAGFVPVALGPRVLRTETAGMVAIAVLQALHGDLR
ncbi:MAG: 16S rRNA (uracil(1498)-N(3))-methyltransferase [Steroidobacteraceae bacterium]